MMNQQRRKTAAASCVLSLLLLAGAAQGRLTGLSKQRGVVEETTATQLQSGFLQRLLQDTFGSSTPAPTDPVDIDSFGSATPAPEEEDEPIGTRLGAQGNLDDTLTAAPGESVNPMDNNNNDGVQFGDATPQGNTQVANNDPTIRAQAAPAFGGLGTTTEIEGQSIDPLDSTNNNNGVQFGDATPLASGNTESNDPAIRAQGEPALGGLGTTTEIESESVNLMDNNHDGVQFGDATPQGSGEIANNDPTIRAQAAPAHGGLGTTTEIEGESINPMDTNNGVGFGDATAAQGSEPVVQSTPAQGGLGTTTEIAPGESVNNNEVQFGDAAPQGSGNQAINDPAIRAQAPPAFGGLGTTMEIQGQSMDNNNNNGVAFGDATPQAIGEQDNDDPAIRAQAAPAHGELGTTTEIEAPAGGGYLNSIGGSGFGSSTPVGELENQAQRAPAQGNGFGAQQTVPVGSTTSSNSQGISFGTQASAPADGGPSSSGRLADLGLLASGTPNNVNGFGTQMTVSGANTSPQGSGYLSNNGRGTAFGSATTIGQASGSPVQQTDGNGFGTQQSVPLGSSNTNANSDNNNNNNNNNNFASQDVVSHGAGQMTNGRGNSVYSGTGGSQSGIEVQGDIRTQKCDMKIKFFPGKEKKPTPDDVGGLLKITDKYFNHLYGTDNDTKGSFKRFHATEIEHSYGPSFGEDIPFFRCEFTSNIQLKRGSKVTMSKIHNIINTADFEDFIRNYIWKSPPEGKNQFYETNICKLECTDAGTQGR